MKPNLIRTGLLTAALLALPAVVQAQFNYTTTNGTVTITGYTGSGGAVTIPATINGLPVTSIGDSAFRGEEFFLTSVTIPNSVTNIEDSAFAYCYGLTKVTIPDSVISIGYAAFYDCESLTSVTIGNSVTTIGSEAFGATALTNVTIGNSVTSIGDHAFASCFNLTNVTMGNSVTNIEDNAFEVCKNLTNVYFKGNVPTTDGSVFLDGDSYSGVLDPVTVYYLPGTLGWSDTFAGRPTALWLPQVQIGDDSFGVRTNQFGFNIAWASGQTVVMETCTNLSNPVWFPVATNTLTGDSSYFSDPQSSNYPTRFYRLRSP